MARVLIVGAGIAGLSTAMLLTRAGHVVTVVERDEHEPPAQARDAWRDWQRRGVNQFRLPHLMLPKWWSLVREELPEITPALKAAGALTTNQLACLPTDRRGPLRTGDQQFETTTARRPVLEAAVAAAAASEGVVVQRGVRVAGLIADGGTAVPRVTGVVTEDGRTFTADLVVDCGGRRSALPTWLTAAGARPVREERADHGFVYYGRHFRSASGELPPLQEVYRHNYDSVSVLTLPADNGTWSVTFIAAARDKALRALRDPDRWRAAVSLYPLVADWADAEPISGVDVIAGIEDRRRRLVTDDGPVATGIVSLGDAWACTNPSLGRGTSMAVMHACLLRDLLAQNDPNDHVGFALGFAARTAEVLDPLYDATQWADAQRSREIDADVLGEPYSTDDRRWHVVKALSAASWADQELVRSLVTIASFLAPPAEVLGRPGVMDRVLELGAQAPQYPLPGPRRPELLAALR
jgi:2-polyprenyl-6-methoxyphenol hydroxylase-like FAD-dependent oxidoreductase